VYFTHPDHEHPTYSSIQMAELKIIDGVLTCDRDAEIDCDWQNNA